MNTAFQKLKWGYVLTLVCVLAFMASCSKSTDSEKEFIGSIQSYSADNECWPEVPGPFENLANNSVKTYHEQGRDYRKFLPIEEKYDSFGDFLNWGRDKENAYDSIPKDPYGIVTSKGETENYNPCTIAQYALTLYGKFLHGNANKRAFLHQADFLISMIEDDGSVRYYFDYPYYCNENYFKAGWCSAMDCGHILSVCARAYHITGDEKYADAAKKVLEFLMVPIEEDGVMTTLKDLDPSLDKYVIFEEYPAEPATYTLNGFMYTLIGIYDWSCVDSPSQDQAKELFDKGILTLTKILPYYDIGGFTAYDLSHMTMDRDTPHIGVGYHCEHTAFCKIFYDITGDEIFNEYYTKWKSYVDE